MTVLIAGRITERMNQAARVIQAESFAQGVSFQGVRGWIAVVEGYLLEFSNEELFFYVGAYAGATRREAVAVVIEDFFPSP